MKFELARIIRLCTQLLVGYLWPIVGRKGSYHDGQALPEVFCARNCQPGMPSRSKSEPIRALATSGPEWCGYCHDAKASSYPDV
jgi:hypothetical protein